MEPLAVRVIRTRRRRRARRGPGGPRVRRAAGTRSCRQDSAAGASTSAVSMHGRSASTPRRARAAPISSRNSGCGRSGRLLNSGWACVPTQYGWSGSSMNSTSRLSGEVPLHTKPAASKLGPVLLVELVAVTVTLADDRLAVGRGDLAALREHGVVGAEPHRAALVGDVALVEHQVDHRVLRRRVELGRVGSGEPELRCGRTRRSSPADPRHRPRHGTPSSRA